MNTKHFSITIKMAGMNYYYNGKLWMTGSSNKFYLLQKDLKKKTQKKKQSQNTNKCDQFVYFLNWIVHQTLFVSCCLIFFYKINISFSESTVSVVKVYSAKIFLAQGGHTVSANKSSCSRSKHKFTRGQMLNKTLCFEINITCIGNFLWNGNEIWLLERMSCIIVVIMVMMLIGFTRIASEERK